MAQGSVQISHPSKSPGLNMALKEGRLKPGQVGLCAAATPKCDLKVAKQIDEGREGRGEKMHMQACVACVLLITLPPALELLNCCC